MELVRCIYIGSASVAVLWHVVAVLRAYPFRLLACYLIARSGHRLATVGTVVAPLAPDRQRGGVFSERGEGQTETHPVPIFMREVEKNVIFQHKMGEIQRIAGEFQRKTDENGENSAGKGSPAHE